MPEGQPRRRVLVVDDNLAAAEMLGIILERLGNEVRTAGDGEEALRVAEAFLPEIVLMDLGMPKMDGYTAARHIRSRPWGRSMVLVALTGWGQEEDKRRSEENGFNRHLVKPTGREELERLFAELPPA
jgi:CheY-like chemotaxis protein